MIELFVNVSSLISLYGSRRYLIYQSCCGCLYDVIKAQKYVKQTSFVLGFPGASDGRMLSKFATETWKDL